MANPKLEQPQLTSTAVMSFPQPPLRNAEEYLKAYTGYVYTAISAIAQEVASIDLHLFKAKFVKGEPETTEIYEHESLSLLHYVNPLFTLYDLIEATQIYLELTGESYWIVLKQGTTPKELWLLRPDWIKVVPDPKTIIKHYLYLPGGNYNEKIVIPKENVIPFKYFNPLNPYRGKGSVQAAALPFDILNFAQEYNRNFFFNSALPNMIFSTEKKLSDQVVKRFMNQWQASYGGRGKSNKIAFLGGGLKLDKVSQTSQELDFTQQQKMMRDDVLAVFKVPKTILGLTDDVNRANAEATTRAFMERVVTPRMTKFVETLNEYLMPMYGDDNLFFDFTDPAPEDTEAKLKRYESGRKYGWLTANEIRAEENMEPVEGGDDLKPVGGGTPNANPEENPEEKPSEEGEEKPTEEGEEKPTAEEGKSFINKIISSITGNKKVEVKKIIEVKKKVIKKKLFKHMVRLPTKKLETLEREHLEEKLAPALTKIIGDLLHNDKPVKKKKEDKKEELKVPLFTEERKVAYWKQFIEHVTGWEQELRNLTVDGFKEQEHMVMDLLDGSVKFWRKEVRKGKASSAIPSVVDMNKIWETAFLNAIKEIFIEQGNYTLDFLGVGGNIDLTTETAALYLREYGAQLVNGIDETTRQALKDTLSEGFEKGEGIDILKNRVKDVFSIAKTSRAEMIARTETLRASNSATVEAYRQSGVVSGKEWLAERDDRACEFCLSMDGKVVSLNKNYFKPGDTINAEGQTMTIGDLPIGEPPLHPNCRCTTIPILVD